MSSNVVTQNSSNIGSPKNEHIDIDVNVHKEQGSDGGDCKNFPGNSKENSHDSSNVSRSMIDGLFGKNVNEQGTSLVNKIHAVIFHFFSRNLEIFMTDFDVNISFYFYRSTQKQMSDLLIKGKIFINRIS